MCRLACPQQTLSWLPCYLPKPTPGDMHTPVGRLHTSEQHQEELQPDFTAPNRVAKSHVRKPLSCTGYIAANVTTHQVPEQMRSFMSLKVKRQPFLKTGDATMHAANMQPLKCFSALHHGTGVLREFISCGLPPTMMEHGPVIAPTTCGALCEAPASDKSSVQGGDFHRPQEDQCLPPNGLLMC